MSDNSFYPRMACVPDTSRCADEIASNVENSPKKSGNPNNPKIPRWVPYNTTDRPVLVFDNQTRLENDPNAGLRLMWERMAS